MTQPIGRGKDGAREYLGRVVDGVFYSREEYPLKVPKKEESQDVYL